MQYFLYYLVAVSVLSAFVTILDKSAAKAHRWRVPERTLLILSALGGGVAMYMTMRLIRHKTRHKKFMLGIPCIIIAEAILGIAIYCLCFR